MAKLSILQELRLLAQAQAVEIQSHVAARDHLRQQANELKGVCLALTRKLKNAAAERSSIGETDAAWNVPVRLSKEEWAAATSPESLAGGKGAVLLVMPQDDGSVLVDLTDTETLGGGDAQPA